MFRVKNPLASPETESGRQVLVIAALVLDGLSERDAIMDFRHIINS
jgi:hypothetical protein